MGQDFDTAVKLRWPEGVRCPRCGSGENARIETRLTWYCRGCGRQFSLKVGTPLEDSGLGIETWMRAVELLTVDLRVTSRELAGALRITQKSAWFVMARIRQAVPGLGVGMGFEEAMRELLAAGRVSLPGVRRRRSVRAEVDEEFGKINSLDK